jgi:arylformamidase
VRAKVFGTKVCWELDFKEGIDLSIRIRDGLENTNAFYAPVPVFSPVVSGGFVGDVRQGGPVNFYTVRITPHGNGTHTECIGHLSPQQESVLDCLSDTVMLSRLITVLPQKSNGDRVIHDFHFKEIEREEDVLALIVRTMPNEDLKRIFQYGGTNPPYFDPSAIEKINELGFRHLLVDLPSIDPEKDGGLLLAHKTFWKPGKKRELNKTITELIFVPDHVSDGLYLLNLQIANIHLDASPSRPVIYPLRPDPDHI